jgi:hypothetical protein
MPDLGWSGPAESSAVTADQDAELIAQTCWVDAPRTRVVSLPLALNPEEWRGDTGSSDPGAHGILATE